MTSDLFDFLNKNVFPLIPELTINQLLDRIGVEIGNTRIETINDMTKRVKKEGEEW